MLIDLSQVQAPGEIKDGVYTIRVEEIELKNTKAGTGQYIGVKFRAEEAGENFFFNFNISNPNPEAVQIGLGQLKAFLTAIGENPASLDASQLWPLQGKRCMATIKCKPSDRGMDVNVSSFKKLEDVGQIPSFT